MTILHIGCAGFPQRQALCYQALDVVEVQATFYKPPQVQTVQRWRADAPPSFAFTMKAWQLITHSSYSQTYRRTGIEVLPERASHYGSFHPSSEVRSAWERTRQVALGMQAAYVLFQCPASFTPAPGNIRNMRQFFSEMDRQGLLFTWEPRGEWPDLLVAELCRDLNLVHCVDPFDRRSVTAGVGYFRMHGRGSSDYRYTDDELDEVAQMTAAFDEVWLLFNNTAMWDDAARFRLRYRQRYNI